ncbi:stage V sporulation protein D (Sporulation-specific penicillin-binding protein),Penicillin-binding protein 2,peptidoglycan synthase FtsI,Membrane carboxypeptidase/penicillin-binding protein,stage V sporulation protein D,Penicillin binding protein transpeptidase domain [[Clostridium] sordellii]|uniref:stage V sporulation protein D n=1 Tax=Paraclostridium sordellii TaxID=1505 RepID=UPI000543D2C4|nr:stage V sporulation protein D [Paeniclostridium sordellii]CEK35589.1 stage V sporulation protein D (Sporulation-specific penicillin-binding protein),Penicillin-binding protein 2,peptidoglycan synthase FtsI,Membrane carboxypeptidase/penicillin-binding protein,stage V sporulation protein D,Penicillin binding protein transpeptidase domain [[Clostridium] sordellii] [Paeniclostridium sordellii]
MSKIKRISKKRLVAVLIMACCVFFMLIFRTGYLQIVKGDWLTAKALDQQTRDIPIEPKRGTIYDKNMKELAVSVTKYTIWAKPVEVKDKEKAAKVISNLIDEEHEEVLKLLKKKNMALVKVKRWIDDETAEKIREAKLPGIWVAEDNQRYYPYGNFASYVLGHTSDDATGIAGVEMQYDKHLKGKSGRLIVSTDASGREIPHGMEKYYEPVQGNGLVLTIDEVIQHYTEKAVQKAYELNNAKRVTAIAIDPKTGDVLSMASKPDYDPNNSRAPIYPYYEEELEGYGDKDKIKGYFSMWRNPAVSDTYEPGSTFKLITSSAALEEGVIKEGEKFNCTGSVMVGGRKIKCWRHYKPHGAQEFKQGVQNSCNPVFVELGSRLGVSKMYDYIEGFGFMDTTKLDLPGEAKGILYNEKNVGPVELATISFGQSISVTPMQLISAIGAIANDGKLMQPRVVKELVDNQGNVTESIKPKVVRQVISEDTSNKMMEIAESVVSEGSGKAAYIPGYRIGGKTGTAQKVIDGKYAQGKYICSFVGIAPCDDPQIVVLAIVDEPTGVSAFGSTTAGPIVKEIMNDSLKYLGVEPKYSEEEKQEYEKEKVKVPNIIDLSVEDAIKVLEENKLKPIQDVDTEIKGTAKVVDIFPKPGAEVSVDSGIVIYTEN